MINGLSLPATLAAPPASAAATTATAGTPGFAQALHAADQAAAAPQPGRAVPDPTQQPPAAAQRPDGPAQAEAASEPAPEDRANRATVSPPAQRSTQAPRPLPRPPMGTAVPDCARAPVAADTESPPPDAAASREADPRVPTARNHEPPSLQALLAGWQPPSDAAPPAPAAAWGAPTSALPEAPIASTALLPAPAAVRSVVPLESASAVAAPATPLIASGGTGFTTQRAEAATLISEAGTSGAPPTISSEKISSDPAAPSNLPIPAPGAQAAPATAIAGPPPATQARIAANPHSAAFGPELGVQISTFVRHGVERAELQLHPAEMGPVTVQILVEGANAQVRLWAEQPGTRQALEQAMPALAAHLREGGLTLTGGGVFEQPRQAPEQTQRETAAGAPAAAHPTADAAPLSIVAPARRRGLVDLVA